MPPLQRDGNKPNEIAFDIVIALIASLLMGTILIATNFFDWWYQFSRDHEHWQLDELLGIYIAVLMAGTVVAVRNIVMLKRTNSELEEAQAIIHENANLVCKQERLLAMGHLANGLAHEINNALQPVIGLAPLICRELRSQGKTKPLAYMDIILSSANHAKKVVDNVLDYTRMNAIELSRQPAQALLHQTLRFSSNTLPATVNVRLLGFEDLHNKSINRLFIMGNATALCQIFINLFKNATQAMNNEGVIQVVYKQDVMPNTSKAPAVSVTLSDTGHGMNAELVSRIFDPAFSTKSRSEGTGLGLAIVQNLIQQHQGEIDVVSRPGQGTSFIIYLPLCNSE